MRDTPKLILLPQPEDMYDEMIARFAASVVAAVKQARIEGDDSQHQTYLKAAAKDLEEAIIKQQKTRLTAALPDTGILEKSIYLAAIAARIAVQAASNPEPAEHMDDH